MTYISAHEAAKRLKIELRSVNRACRDGIFKTAHKDAELHWQIDADEVEEYRKTRGHKRGKVPAEYSDALKAVEAAGIKAKRQDVLQICKAIKTGKRLSRKVSCYFFYDQKPLLDFLIDALYPTYKRKLEEVIHPVWVAPKIAAAAEEYRGSCFKQIAADIAAGVQADKAAKHEHI